ncbi:MAG: glycosyltransferase family 2 protein [Desulfobacter sp.]|nr:MAG: glycosyltransferase family 2 protein [Desulfobacter sp.]
MFNDQTVCIVIPAYNEAHQILTVIRTLPEYVDAIIVVDDASTDDTAAVIESEEKHNSRLSLIRHKINQGCGGSLVSGYNWAEKKGYDIIVRMDGDGQMNPDDLDALIKPVADGNCDYAKGNRFFSGKAYQTMPKLRFFGTAFLSLLTKIVSGYWHLSDFQSGFTAINKKALKTIDWSKMYNRYGQPNDQLILLNIENFVVQDVPVDPIYNVGEISGINIKKIVFTLSWLLFKRFFWRLKEKYIIRDFHPLIFFYILGILLGGTSVLLFLRVFYIWCISGHIPSINALAAFASFLASAQFSLFAMWFDMEANKHLKGK